MNFLQDKAFLKELREYHVREYYASIAILDFETEIPIQSISGLVTSGSLNVDSQSPTRRTGSLSLVSSDKTYKITDIDNLISINKKIGITVSMVNPMPATHEMYGDTLDFKWGTFIITQAQLNASTQGTSININFIDKMGFLNGTCGGTLPSSVTFNESEVILVDDDGNEYSEIQYPLIKDIIFELVTHFGNEEASRVVIEDVPSYGRSVVKWNGDTPIRFQTVFIPGTTEWVRDDSGHCVVSEEPVDGYLDVYQKGDIIGYMEEDLTYPGELVGAPGATVTSILDEIVSKLGNFEYFYDIDGTFHFQQKKNYLATGNTPLNFDTSVEYIQDTYLPTFSDFAYVDELDSMQNVSQVSLSPNYTNIKNDFVYWGTKNSETYAQCWYHLAIDERPQYVPKPRTQAEMELTDGEYSLCLQNIYYFKDKTTKQITRYSTNSATLNGEILVGIHSPMLPQNLSSENDWFNWREELYRRALINYGTSTRGSRYDEELLAQWRKLYDPSSTIAEKGATSFEGQWYSYYDKADYPWNGYNVDVLQHPEKIDYWLDLIDLSAPIAKYSINKIGKRTIAKQESTVDTVFSKEVNDIVFINVTCKTESEVEELKEKLNYYNSIGQTVCQMTQEQIDLLDKTTSYATCYDGIRELLYSNLIYNSSISVTALPIFYLEPNKVIRLNFSELNIFGDYVINRISYQLGNNSTMSLSLQEAQVII